MCAQYRMLLLVLALAAVAVPGCKKPSEGGSRPGASDRVQRLAEKLEDPDPEVRYNSYWELRKEAPQQTVSYFIKGLGDPNADVRSMAAMLLAKCEGKAREAVPVLIQKLDDEDESVRLAASHALCSIEGEHRGLGVMVSCLRRRQDWRGKLNLVHCILFVSPDIRPEAAPVILGLLSDPNPRVRAIAAGFFQSIGQTPESVAAIPALIELLKDDNEDVKISAICALGANRGAARDAIDPLKRIMASGNERLMENARWALDLIE